MVLSLTTLFFSLIVKSIQIQYNYSIISSSFENSRPGWTPVTAKTTCGELVIIFKLEGNEKILPYMLLCPCTKYVILRQTDISTHTNYWKGQTKVSTNKEPSYVKWCTVLYLQCQVFAMLSVWRLPWRPLYDIHCSNTTMLYSRV